MNHVFYVLFAKMKGKKSTTTTTHAQNHSGIENLSNWPKPTQRKKSPLNQPDNNQYETLRILKDENE